MEIKHIYPPSVQSKIDELSKLRDESLARMVRRFEGGQSPNCTYGEHHRANMIAAYVNEANNWNMVISELVKSSPLKICLIVDSNLPPDFISEIIPDNGKVPKIGDGSYNPTAH